MGVNIMMNVLLPSSGFYSVLKMEASGSTEMSVLMYHTSGHHFPECHEFGCHQLLYLKSYII